jgi:drug/metabolite transporter (DMT)-like permease
MTRLPRSRVAPGVLLAVLSAVTFGVTTPLIARFGTGAGPLVTAALLYAGAASISLALRPFVPRSGRALTRAALPRLLVIALFGAALAPVLLVWGLTRAGPTGSSLLLNFEAAFTVLFARAIYAEPLGRRVIAAIVAMVLGGALMALDSARAAERAQVIGLLVVLAATASWALDNTLTRALAEEEPFDVVVAKGTIGAFVTGSLAVLLGEPAPRPAQTIALLLCGAAGYGFSLRLYLLAQRSMGAARTASVFAAGPFVGAVLGWMLGDRGAGVGTVLGAVALATGVYLHLTERHVHGHVHESIEHEHAHRHDDGHHDHVHLEPVSGEHTHRHRHDHIEHEHDHAPDVHHEHVHS